MRGEVRVVSPMQNGRLLVHVANANAGGGMPGAGLWDNECQAIPRLGAAEGRAAWLDRVATFVEQHHDRLASITYPPGDGPETALVCFSTPVTPILQAPSGPREGERPARE